MKLLHSIDKRLAVIEALNKKQSSTLEKLDDGFTRLKIRVYSLAATISAVVSAVLTRVI